MSQIYFIWSNVLHVSDGLSIHHQEFKTVHTATGMSNRYCLLLASGNEMEHDRVPGSKQSAVCVRHMPVAVRTVLNS